MRSITQIGRGGGTPRVFGIPPTGSALGKICFCLCLIVVAGASCDSRVLDSGGAENQNRAAAKNDKVYHLGIKDKPVVQAIEPGDLAEGRSKFVQIEVTEVTNPKRYAITFSMDYQPKGDSKIHLGDFSLFPADNPGKFIVPTQGKVKNEGAIVLSLVVPDTVDPSDPLQVTVKKMKFVNE